LIVLVATSINWSFGQVGGSELTMWQNQHKLASTPDLRVLLASIGAGGVCCYTFLQLLQALEGDLELVRRVEWRGVVLDLDTEKRDDRHVESCV
jgi:hypothetical protein